MVEEPLVGKCEMCKEEIYSFHQSYYSCKDCDYSLHKFCAEMPTTQQNHPFHPGHNLTLSQKFQRHDPDVKFKETSDSSWYCQVCKIKRTMFYNYHCYICKFDMDIVCATMSQQKMNHPSHPHQLQRDLNWMTSHCYACEEKHSGVFYHCTTCLWFRIHLDCALLPAKLLIQKSTNGSFSHLHLLTLYYSPFPYIEQKAKFFPSCRVCDRSFVSSRNRWYYGCHKCRYYIHVRCATSRPGRLDRTYKNFEDHDHPNLIHCPFPDESANLLTHQFVNKGELVLNEMIDGQLFSHQHPLILVKTLLNESVSLNDPMKRVELLCDGCVRPITALPFYKCSQHNCGFVLHEWCTRLPSEILDHPDHPEHKLVLLPKMPENLLGTFRCAVCRLSCNGFAYGCIECKYYVDINCGFIPDAITHEAHPNHLLLRFKASPHQPKQGCKACDSYIEAPLRFHCPTCDFSLHTECALSIPRTIRHKFDKHPLSLRYYPVENYSSDYFCEICEDVLNPREWFYHCNMCAWSIHTECAPVKLECERFTSSEFNRSIFAYYNVKFGGRYKMRDHPHLVTFVQGIKDDGQCIVCHEQLQYERIFKCFECKFALHFGCEEPDVLEIPQT
ncbi:hypothetical protein M8C21_011336 [Ambrosia artemisiifolia]|uniref:Phorbol-ester/DAG-type domain-containing protein n=1 Tax=Ambrosia artemisiifolia TaxID=4212 RepID=A0AAD5C022_AMBAR|nr:hypothetical protein M8C21_011336 [Ambrosia artemisiifolia]